MCDGICCACPACNKCGPTFVPSNKPSRDPCKIFLSLKAKQPSFSKQAAENRFNDYFPSKKDFNNTGIPCSNFRCIDPQPIAYGCFKNHVIPLFRCPCEVKRPSPRTYQRPFDPNSCVFQPVRPPSKRQIKTFCYPIFPNQKSTCRLRRKSKKSLFKKGYMIDTKNLLKKKLSLVNDDYAEIKTSITSRTSIRCNNNYRSGQSNNVNNISNISYDDYEPYPKNYKTRYSIRYDHNHERDQSNGVQNMPYDDCDPCPKYYNSCGNRRPWNPTTGISSISSVAYRSSDQSSGNSFCPVASLQYPKYPNPREYYRPRYYRPFQPDGEKNPLSVPLASTNGAPFGPPNWPIPIASIMGPPTTSTTGVPFGPPRCPPIGPLTGPPIASVSEQIGRKIGMPPCPAFLPSGIDTQQNGSTGSSSSNVHPNRTLPKYASLISRLNSYPIKFRSM